MPVALQVALLDRVLRYERTFASERSPVSVILVMRTSSAESVRVTAQLTSELQRVGALGGREIEITTVPFSTGAALRAGIAGASARLVILCPGLSDVVSAVRSAASGAGLIVVSTVGAYVDLGAVIGFELRPARPRIAVNLAEARERRLHFDPPFLRLAPASE